MHLQVDVGNTQAVIGYRDIAQFQRQLAILDLVARRTGERLTEVTCLGWGDDSPILKDNAYKNPFWSATAFFKTDRDHAFRVGVYWKAAVRGCERGQWIVGSFADGLAVHLVPAAGSSRAPDPPAVQAVAHEVPEHWLGVTGQPSTLNGSPVRTRA